MGVREKSARGLAHSKTLRAREAMGIRASVLECAGPPALSSGGRLSVLPHAQPAHTCFSAILWHFERKLVCHRFLGQQPGDDDQQAHDDHCQNSPEKKSAAAR